MRYVRTDTESGTQETLFSWTSWQIHAGNYKELALLFHVPNGGKRNAREAANLKRQGVKAGVPDLVLPVARGKYHGLFIELKVGKNKTTELQDEWLRNLKDQGYYTAVCYGWQQAAELLKAYLDNEINKGEAPEEMSVKEWQQHFADKVKEKLEAAGMTQRELAEKAELTEVAISRYVSGERVPDAERIVRIARTLQCSTDELINTGKIIDIKDKDI